MLRKMQEAIITTFYLGDFQCMLANCSRSVRLTPMIGRCPRPNSVRLTVFELAWLARCEDQDRFAFVLAFALQTLSLPSRWVIMGHTMSTTKCARAARCGVCPLTDYELGRRLEPLHRFHIPCCVQADIATSRTAGGVFALGLLNDYCIRRRLINSPYKTQPLPWIYI